MGNEALIRREDVCAEIQKILNYCGGEYTFDRPVLLKTDYDKHEYESCKSLGLGEDCFVGFTEYSEPIYQDRIYIESLLHLIIKLRSEIKLSDLSQTYSDLSLFFCWSISDRDKQSSVNTVPAGTDENYTIALDEFHKSCTEIEARFPGFASEDTDDMLWYDEFIDDILPLYMSFVDHHSFDDVPENNPE